MAFSLRKIMLSTVTALQPPQFKMPSDLFVDN